LRSRNAVSANRPLRTCRPWLSGHALHTGFALRPSRTRVSGCALRTLRTFRPHGAGRSRRPDFAWLAVRPGLALDAWLSLWTALTDAALETALALRPRRTGLTFFALRTRRAVLAVDAVATIFAGYRIRPFLQRLDTTDKRRERSLEAVADQFDERCQFLSGCHCIPLTFSSP
jgi:hypothetical protein